MTETGRARWRVAAVRSGAVPPLAEGFTTRPETAPGLDGALVPGSAVALVSGEPGQRGASCGKTQLAVHAAESLWRLGQVELLAWVDASSRASLLAGYLQAAAAIGIEPTGPAEQVAARLTGWLASTTRPWLVVLDDLRDAADLDGLWPRGPAGTVLATMSDEEAVAGQPRARVVPVGAFSTREAMSYLMGRLAADPDQRQGAIDLAITLGGDPCALTHASALIATTTQTCRDYQHHYTGCQARLEARRAGGGPPPAPAVTWLLSAERAEQLSPGGATQHLLALTALLDGEPVPGPVLTTPSVCAFLAEAGVPAADPGRAWEAVRALERAGLLVIDSSTASSVVRISRVVAALARTATPGQMLGRAAHAVADALLEVWPEQEPQPWLAAQLRSCVASLQRSTADRLWVADACHPLLLKAGHSLDAARLTGPATRYWTEFTATSERILGPDNPHTLTAGTCLAQALLAAGQASEATAWWRWVAAGRARVSGADHPATIAARVNLGQAIAAAGQPGDAVTVLEQAVADYERVHGPGHPETLSARDELASACQAAGQPGEAIGHYRRILADRERAYGPRHPGTMAARERLASACLADGRLKEAISGYKKTLADRQRVLGTDHLDTIATQRNLAAACHAAGQIAAALQLHEQACTGYEQALGADHPDTIAARMDLANAYHAAGRVTDAATLLRSTLTRCEQALPPDDPLIRALRDAMTGLAGG